MVDIKLAVTAQEWEERGRAARKDVPHEALGELTITDRDPVAILAAQDETRVQDLVPLRRERMSVSAFTFYRGSAAIMAYDLARQAQTGTQVVICGDAHLSNFGFYASPERRTMFDLNDFDEAAPGPWEWDVKRLLVSVLLAARARGMSAKSAKEMALHCASTYRRSLERLLDADAVSRFYLSVDSDLIAARLGKKARKSVTEVLSKAERNTSARAAAKMMKPGPDGRMMFHEQPPVLTHVPEATDDVVATLFERYAGTVRPDVRLLLRKFTLTDIARRVVGVGSVGTRCYVLALTGVDGSKLILQIKEANESVVCQNNVPNETTPGTLPDGMTHGQRVVVHQQILQATSDPFLGFLTGAEGRSFYVRQFRDRKGSVDVENVSKMIFTQYVAGCGVLLARAHAQSPMSHWMGGYIGTSDAADQALVRWSRDYIDVVDSDYRRFLAAGELPAPKSAARRPAPKRVAKK